MDSQGSGWRGAGDHRSSGRVPATPTNGTARAEQRSRPGATGEGATAARGGGQLPRQAAAPGQTWRWTAAAASAPMADAACAVQAPSMARRRGTSGWSFDDSVAGCGGQGSRTDLTWLRSGAAA
jgi:hypothetical protein